MRIEVTNKNLGRLRLIPLYEDSDDDYAAYKEIYGNPEIMKTASIFNRGIAQSEEENRKYFTAMTSTNTTHGIGICKILDESNDFIGITGYGLVEKHNNDDPKIVEIIYFIKPEYQNKKIGFDISKALVEYLLSNFPTVYEILGIALFDNIPSQLIMLKLGFEYVTRKVKRGSVINIHILTPEIYKKNKHKIYPTEHYVKFLHEINNREYEFLEEADSSLI